MAGNALQLVVMGLLLGDVTATAAAACVLAGDTVDVSMFLVAMGLLLLPGAGNLATGKVLSVLTGSAGPSVASGDAMTTGIERGMVESRDELEAGAGMVASLGRGGGGGAGGTGAADGGATDAGLGAGETCGSGVMEAARMGLGVRLRSGKGVAQSCGGESTPP